MTMTMITRQSAVRVTLRSFHCILVPLFGDLPDSETAVDCMLLSGLRQCSELCTPRHYTLSLAPIRPVNRMASGDRGYVHLTPLS